MLSFSRSFLGPIFTTFSFEFFTTLKKDCSKAIPVKLLFFGVELNLITLYLANRFSVEVECTKESGKFGFAYT